MLNARLVASAVLLVACECEPPLPTPVAEDAGSPDVDAGFGMDAGELPDSGPPPDAGGLDAGRLDPCGATMCTPGQRCEAMDDDATCVDNLCEDLECDALSRCEPHPQGGHVCVSIACSTDVQCAAEEFCDGTTCAADVCVPGTRICAGAAVEECASNGGSNEPLFTCGSAGAFVSTCSVVGGQAACGCGDDWDCPQLPPT